ncbi:MULTISPECIES: phosphoribosyl-AMP cyclohydrolase [unclassified Erythrobacter]|uniref:phosphoribosyl-AMP cyclohydrolase n=1 Tax=unclassified Erythrobacter TaxID=2633097 RepID=UPI0009F86A5F|nr:MULTISPECIES: phosphoribosyl-AMP cyclohydrolase [unclassified Erythrobacter]MBO6526827.1 phosphoribosyl-AMP cyclohydrolase [Erythrobacter sp.]MBO6528500.1 phosphoribosyl-AMP cyclohydrolase [Erythrobacter sp.]
MTKILLTTILAGSSLALAACSETTTEAGDGSATAETAVAADPITEAEVEAAQQAWGEGIVAIGQTYTEEGDYRARAQEHIATHYAYGDDQTILFKPTLAAEDQFRENDGEALSYFVGTEGTEDGGFAIAPYTGVRWENNGTVISDSGDMAVAMGNYYFTGTDGNETKVEYSFAYERGDDGELKIVLHHSSLPYSAN